MVDKKKILVVDDEEVIVDIFSEYLEATGNYTVLTAADGLEALETIKHEPIDCCFTDITMPRLDGLELVSRIHHFDNTIPVVVMTGYPSMDKAIQTLKNGVVDFLTKPVKMDQVPLAIERVLRERSLYVDNILLREEAEKKEQLVKINQELREKISEVETINLIFEKLDSATTSGDLFGKLVDLSGEITVCDEAYFCIPGHESIETAIIASFVRDKKRKLNDISLINDRIVKKVADDGIPLIARENGDCASAMGIPLKIRSRVFGVLVSILRDNKRFFSEKDLYLLNFLTERASSQIENIALYENIYENIFSTLYAFVETIEAKDIYTKQHSTRVTDYAVSIAIESGCLQEELDALTVSGNLHDIGKIGIPDDILLKPAGLSSEEYEIIKKHPVIGSNIISHFSMWSDEQIIVKHHHERWDGGGYPDGLKGEAIPFSSRILAVADTFDALTSDRSYRNKKKADVAADIIRENSGTQFDPDFVDIFLKLYEKGKIKTAE